MKLSISSDFFWRLLTNRAFQGFGPGGPWPLRALPIAGAPRASRLFFSPRCIFPAFLAVLIVCGCSSLLEKTGRVFDGSAFAEEELALYRLPWAQDYTGAEGEKPDEEPGSVEVRRLVRKEDGQEFLAISLGTLPGLRINGTIPDETGAFYLVSLDFFCSNISGWNMFTMELSGAGVFLNAGGQRMMLTIQNPVEPVNIIRGKIRRDETRLTGEEALSALRNRQERINALCEWMRSRENTPRFRNQTEFENYWKPILLPEMLQPGERAPGWKEEGAQWQRGEDISWNSSYTLAAFPENLWKVRDSGTLLRDWEEAIDWIFFIYEWEDIFSALSNSIIFEGVQ
jgi:hypothetical protein